MVRSLTPPHLDYLLLNLVVALLLVLLFGGHLKNLMRRRAFWISLGLFFVLATVVELWALAAGWWEFNQERILGLSVIGIPVEEYILFVEFFAVVICSWQFASDPPPRNG